jgi:hypothetical protein
MYAKVGAQSAKDGTVIPFKADTMGGLCIAGKYTQATLEGRIFSVANQAAVTTTAAMTGTYTGLILQNPLGSGKNAIMHEFGWMSSVVGSHLSSIGLMTGTWEATNTVADNIVPIKNGLVGGPRSSLYADDGATIVAPIVCRHFGCIGTAATGAVQNNGPFIYQIDGSIILPPGGYIAAYTLLGTTTCLAFHFMWEERPI